MDLISVDIEAFRKQLERGHIQKAYRALVSYMSSLRLHFKNNLANTPVSGLYIGYMDMTYFALFPSSLKQHDLKIALVFNYDSFRFEAWLVGRNRAIQQKYWELFKDHSWLGYRVVTRAKGIDSILEYDLSVDFDLNINDQDALTTAIEKLTRTFINDIEGFLAECQPLKQGLTTLENDSDSGR